MYWKVICAKDDMKPRIRYFKEPSREEAAARVRALMKLVPHGWRGWEIVAVETCSEAEFVRNTGPRR